MACFGRCRECSEWLLDLAWAARADCIVSRDPHLTGVTMPFPVEVLEPHQLLERLPA